MILSIIIGILVLSLLIFVHEAGHFLAAKMFGVKVEEFGFGFPIPGKIWSFKKGETTYSINWLPAGGFVRLYGEESGANENDPRSFSAQSVWKRIVIAGAGVVINIILAILIFTALLASMGFKQDFNLRIPNQFPFGTQTYYGLVTYVEDGSPAKEVGLKPGDKILKIDGTAMTDSEKLRSYIKDHAGSEIDVIVQNIKDNTQRDISVTPRENPPKGQGALGVALEQGSTLAYNTPVEKIFSGVLHSGNMLQYQWAGMSSLFSQSVKEKSVEPITKNSSGPIGIIAIFSVVLQGGGVEAFRSLLLLTAMISLLLGIFNLLPIPAADGGRLFFFYIEAIFRKKVPAKIENRIHTVGFMILIVLFVLIAFNDVVKIATGRLFG